MATLREIKLRIRSVKSTQKITKAMEMIAASKMKRAQSQAIKGRPYLNKLSDVIGNILAHNEPKLTHPLLDAHESVKNVGYIFVTSNRGLCGAFNSNIIRKMLETVYTEYQGDRTDVNFVNLETYLKRIWFSNGIHHHYASNKFVPGFTPEFFRDALNSVDALKLP